MQIVVIICSRHLSLLFDRTPFFLTKLLTCSNPPTRSPCPRTGHEGKERRGKKINKPTCLPRRVCPAVPPEALIINLFRYANGNATHQPASQPSRLDRATKGEAFSHPRQRREWQFPDTFYTLESFVCTTKGGFAAHIGLSKAFPHVCVFVPCIGRLGIGAGLDMQICALSSSDPVQTRCFIGSVWCKYAPGVLFYGHDRDGLFAGEFPPACDSSPPAHLSRLTVTIIDTGHR